MSAAVQEGGCGRPLPGAVRGMPVERPVTVNRFAPREDAALISR
jgi:hypothetical protein